MPDPDVITKASNNSDCDLKLSGDKIQLKTRPPNKDSRASSRCALLGRGYSRPLSAVPMLTLYRKDDFELDLSKKRPFSAGNISYVSKNKLKHIDLLSNLEDVEDCASSDSNDAENDLPSSELLKSLISEPIKSHRSHAKRSKRQQQLEEHVMASSSSEESLGARIQSAASKRDEELSDGVKHMQISLLTPGLTSKPPLPKKPDTKFNFSDLRINMNEEDTNDSGDNSLLKIDEIEEIRMKSIKFDQEFREKYKCNMSKASEFRSQEIMSEKEFNEFLNATEKNVRDSYLNEFEKVHGWSQRDTVAEDCATNKQKIMDEYKLIFDPVSHASPAFLVDETLKVNGESSVPNPDYNENFYSASKADKNAVKLSSSINCVKEISETIYSDRTFDKIHEDATNLLRSKSDNELNFKNWVREDIRDTKTVVMSEKRTDSYFANLKTHHEEIDRCINKAQEVLDKTRKEDVTGASDQSEVIQNIRYKKIDHSNNTDEDAQNNKFNKFFEYDKSHSQLNSNTTEKRNTDNNLRDRTPPPKNTEKSTKTFKKPIYKKHSCILEGIDEHGKHKPKFVAKAMKSFRDYSEKPVEEEVSWMAKEFAQTEMARTEDVSKKSNVHTQPVVDNSRSNYLDGKDTQNKDVDKWINEIKPANYLDFMESVSDLEHVTTIKGNILNDIPQQDNFSTVDASDTNTYDDIVQILEVLEAEDIKSQKNMESIKQLVSNELCAKTTFKSEEVIAPKSAKNRCAPVVTKTDDTERVSTVSINSSASNYNEILTFLDEVDKNCTKSLVCAKERVHKVTQFLEKAICLDTVPKKEDLQALTNEELSDQIVHLNLRIKEKTASITLLQDELSTLREQVVKGARQTEEMIKQKLKSQKDEHEAIVKRHQKFIDQLIADKKALNQQCEGLINEMKVLEDRYKSNMKATEHRHHVEMQKVKEMHVAGEKIRRDRWIDNKTQKIKELTVKSLEPELQSMAARQQHEISDLRALQKRELEDLELKAARKTQQQCEALREQLIAEREKALAHEREIMRQRYEKLVECEEKGYQEQRRRLCQEHANRVAECEEREAAAVVERDRAIKHAQDEFEEKKQAMTRRHANEIKMLKEATELEMEAWKTNYRKQQNLQLTQKEAHIREQCRKERDREIETVIERLESESNETKNQIEQTTENRIRRMKEKFDNEIGDLELSEKETKSKYSETRSKLLECEDVIISLRATIKQLETQLKECKEVSDKLTAERNQMKNVVREEMKKEIRILEKEVTKLKDEKDKELQQVYSRVKIAVARKDELLEELTRDHAALQEKCVYLENMLQQQRKEYLIK